MNTMVSFGLFLSRQLRKFKMGKTMGLAVRTNQALVVTDNLNLLKALSEVLPLPVKSGSKLRLNDSDIRETMIIFDEEYMSYNQIFKLMQELKNRGNQFRIRPSHCAFIIGSDKSDEKGSVVVF